MQALVQQAVAQDWRPLPHALHKAAAFHDSVRTLVLDVLMDKVSSLRLCSNLSCVFEHIKMLRLA